MKEMLGEEYAAFYASYDLPKYQALRINPLKTERDTFLQQAPFSLDRVPWTTNGYYYSGNDQPGRHPYHEAGVYYIQEPSAMAPAEYLMAEPGERILDLCAAPGGKSTQIACSMQGEGLIVCNEIHPARAKILSENIERMGVCNALVTNETPQKLSDNFREYFDRILVDAPCSGEGMFRKNEDACDEWSPENVENCAARQAEILDCAAEMLKPGGRLVYSTCTFAPTENEGSISRFLERHPEFSILPVEKKDGMVWAPKWENDPNRMVSVVVDGRTYDVVTSSNGQFIFHVQVSEIVPNYRISVQPTDDPKNVSFIHYSDVTGDTQTVITGRYKSANNISNRYFSPDVSSINIIAPCAKMRFEPEIEPDGWNSYLWDVNVDD